MKTLSLTKYKSKLQAQVNYKLPMLVMLSIIYNMMIQPLVFLKIILMSKRKEVRSFHTQYQNHRQ